MGNLFGKSIKDCCEKYESCPKQKTKDELCKQDFPCMPACGNGYIREVDRNGKVRSCVRKKIPCEINQYRKHPDDVCRSILTGRPVAPTESFSINYQESNKRILEYILLILIFYLFYRLIKLKEK